MISDDITCICNVNIIRQLQLILTCMCLQCYCLQCFDAVGWAARRASSL